MRDWEAGPVRRLGDGKDFAIGSTPQTPGASQELEQLLVEQRKQPQKKQARIETPARRQQANAKKEEPGRPGTVRVPVLAGPGTKGKTVVVNRRADEKKDEDQA
jgi:hypothetical protein